MEKPESPTRLAIEGDFSKDNPSRADGGVLPGGTGWYRKTFEVDKESKGKKFFIDFDGVYMNSEVYFNGNLLGKRPYGYISFRYDMTPYLHFDKPNVLAVKVDNSKQPNSRWYSGCGIYRHVWLTVLDPVHVDHWGTYITTHEVSKENVRFEINTTVKNDNNKTSKVEITSVLLDAANKELQKKVETIDVAAGDKAVNEQSITLANPHFWSVDTPYLYNIKTELRVEGKLTDTYYTTTGVRTFAFDVNKGFSLNGERMKINGVCMHHDLGCLGAAVNTRAIERQLEILKAMSR
jgi:beta-galactosidase